MCKFVKCSLLSARYRWLQIVPLQQWDLTLKINISLNSCERIKSMQQTRPRRRRFEALTTDAKIIRLIRWRVAFFPTAAARQFFEGDYGWICREQTLPNSNWTTASGTLYRRHRPRLCTALRGKNSYVMEQTGNDAAIKIARCQHLAYTISRVLTELGLWCSPAKNLGRAVHFIQTKYRETL